MLKATNIIWDTDSPDEAANLPTEIDIPEEHSHNEDSISDYISNLTDFCHKGFDVCEFPDNYAELLAKVQRNCSLDDLYAICQKCKHRDPAYDTAETISMESCFHICLNCPVFDCRIAIEETAAEAACS